MKILIMRTDIDETESSRCLSGTDSAITMELYKKYRSPMGISANHMWSKYTFIDEENEYIGTFDTMNDLSEKRPSVLTEVFKEEVKVLDHVQWLASVNPEWKTVERYQYW